MGATMAGGLVGVLERPCRSCGAAPGESCRTGRGAERVPHAPRVNAVRKVVAAARATSAKRDGIRPVEASARVAAQAIACPMCPAVAGSTCCWEPVGKGGRWALQPDGWMHRSRVTAGVAEAARADGRRFLEAVVARDHEEALREALARRAGAGAQLGLF